MKNKFLKFFIIIPLLFVVMSAFFACGTTSVTALSIALPASVTTIKSGVRYNIEYSSTPVQLEVKLTPSTFSIKNITWSSSNTSLAYVNTTGKLVMTAGSSGDVNISGKYVNEDGTTIYSNILKLNISAEEFPYFASETYQTTYSGADQMEGVNAQQLQAVNADSDVYQYVYYYIGDNETSEQVSSIVNAGTYLLTYVRISDALKFDDMLLTVTKYNLSINSLNTTSVYGSDITEGFFNTTPTESDFSSAYAFNITGGVGKDSGKTIGKYLYTTTATSSSPAGTYSTSIAYKLYDDYADNYTVTPVAKTHTITSQKLVLAVNDQTLNYGDTLTSNGYTLYDYDEYISNSSSIEELSSISSTSVNFKNSITTGDYVLKQDGSSVAENEYGYINAGTYNLSYNSSLLSTNSNVVVSVIISGVLSVTKDEVTVTPDALNSKNYTEEDDYSSLVYTLSSSVPNSSEIKPFLIVDYGEDADYGTGNFMAPVGTYYYAIDNTINPNFTFTLAPIATSAYENEDNQIKFEVKQCPITIKFGNLVEYYKTPTGTDADGNVVPSVSYYSLTPNNSVPNYILDEILSLKINGVEQVADGVVACASDNFDDNGSFALSTGETFKISLQLVSQTTVGSHYATYYVSLQTSSSTQTSNYEISVIKSYVYLDKINVTVTPSLTAGVSSKSYSGDSIVSTSFFSDYTLSSNLESGVLVTSIFGTNQLLSLASADGDYYKLNVDGSYSLQDNFYDCGEYKIFLSSTLEYSSGMEYYNFSLDTSKDYLYEITQKSITITPDENQSKTYGNADGSITYTYGNSILGLSSIVSGSLTRASGENVGTYEISLGTLSFGSNYTLSINSIKKYYTITARQLTITPISYITTYGDDYPTILSYNDPFSDQTYNSSILVKPTFSGEFNLYYGTEIISKVDGHYPAKVVDDAVVAYTIKQGTFACNSNNYVLNVVETSTFLVQQKQATINITAQNVSSSTGISTEISNFTNYTLETDDGTEDVTLSGISFTATESSDKYLIDHLSDISSLTISKNGTDITSSYSLTLGRNVVYYIASTMIELKIVSSTDETSSLVKTTYNGNEQSTSFAVVCATSGFEIDQTSSNYVISYSTNELSSTTPLNAGSYYVSITLSATNKLVITRTSDNTSFEFTSFGTKVNGCVLSLSQYGYLNIARADISYVESELSFVSSLTYGSDESELSNINVSYEQNSETKSIFTGVNGEEITLKRYDDDKNFVFVSSPQTVSTLMASTTTTYSIKVTVQAVNEDDSLNTNYNSLTIDVQLSVLPSEITVDEEGTSLNYTGTYTDGKIVYSGKSSVFALTVSTTPADAVYSNSYTYVRLETIYDSSVAGYVKAYSYNSSTGEVNTSSYTAKTISELSSSTMQRITYSGLSYYLLNSGSEDAFCVYIEKSSATPKDAGIYVCIATCTAGDNYIFSDSSNSVSYFTIFEIERSSTIEISNWLDSFKWGTKFNLDDQSSLPFSFSMSPDFSSKVTYEVADKTSWEELNYILAVGSNYSVSLVIDESNYYISSPQTFSVVSRDVGFEFSDRTSYGYTGTVIDTFLKDIVAVLKNENGVAIEEKQYSLDNTDFKLSYAKTDGTALDSAPSDIGDYVLTVTYGSTTSNYYGTDTFAYTIEKSAFTGQISVVNAELEYNPAYTSTSLYSSIVEGMFSIESGVEYSLSIKYEGSTTAISSSSDWWLSAINKVGTIKMTFTVSFEDDTISDYVDSANLVVTAKKIKDSNFTIPTDNIQYSYTGNFFYNELVFLSTVSLAPSTTIGTVKTYYVGSTSYTVRTFAYNQIKLMDGSGNTIFTLTYNYYLQLSADSTTYKALSSAPLDSQTLNYKVEYVFSSFGTNYKNSLESSSITRYFKINRIDTLYISIYNDSDDNYDSSIIKSYTGEDFYTYFDLTKLNSIVGISNTTSEKTNINKTIFKISASNTYTSGGVNIVVFFTDSSGNVITSLVNAGTYYMNLTFLKSTKYDVPSFFEYIVFNGGESYETATYFRSGSSSYVDNSGTAYTYIYSTVFAIPFTIEKVNCPYSSSNITDALMITPAEGYSYTTEQEGLSNYTVILFDRNTTFTLKDSTFKIVIEYYIQGEYREVTDFDYVDENGQYYLTNFNAGTTYAIKFVDENGNYNTSEHIRFEVQDAS